MDVLRSFDWRLLTDKTGGVFKVPPASVRSVLGRTAAAPYSHAHAAVKGDMNYDVSRRSRSCGQGVVGWKRVSVTSWLYLVSTTINRENCGAVRHAFSTAHTRCRLLDWKSAQKAERRWPQGRRWVDAV